MNSANIWRPAYSRAGRALINRSDLNRPITTCENDSAGCRRRRTLPRPLVGSQRRRPHRIGASRRASRGRTVAEEQFRPFPPGAELLHPAQQVVAGVSAGAMSDVTDPNTAPSSRRGSFAHRPRDLLFGDVTQAGLDTKSNSPSLNCIRDGAELVVLFQRLRRLGVDRLVVFDAPASMPPRASARPVRRWRSRQRAAIAPGPVSRRS